ncbi:MAG: aminopeptidase [Bacillota bacterium]|uniref:Aminopeptidase n=1 Tax=Thermanaerosceptrum fracticalcis TaxID=1712410 RepID=A0A7G6DYY4_THEFR|nr:hypothetical protein [Thermanaerosceptrum fracticalcis]QNB45038.1 hypothetical protein BR63_01090 [Thermanaerosceptrum fracticalcis]
MELNIGIEPASQYLSFETAKGALKLVKDVMLVKEGENVVITADTATDRRVVEAAANAVYSIGAIPTVIYYPTAPNACIEPPKPIGSAVADADVWIEFTYSYIMHTPAWKKSIKNGVRYICLTGMDVEMMVKTITRVDYDLMIEMGEKLKEICQSADEVIIKSENGTNLKAYNRGRKVRHSGQKAIHKGYPVMLGGQVSWCPIESTINGTLVFDGALFPPFELGILRNSVKLELREGRVVDIQGGVEAQIFANWLKSFNDPNMYRLAHYSLGFNPGVTKPTGRIVEDERVFGCIEMGIGSQGAQIMGECWSAASHTDGIVLRPTIILDGVTLEENGIYQLPEIREFCKKLNITGY